MYNLQPQQQQQRRISAVELLKATGPVPSSFSASNSTPLTKSVALVNLISKGNYSLSIVFRSDCNGVITCDLIQ